MQLKIKGTVTEGSPQNHALTGTIVCKLGKVSKCFGTLMKVSQGDNKTGDNKTIRRAIRRDRHFLKTIRRDRHFLTINNPL